MAVAVRGLPWNLSKVGWKHLQVFIVRLALALAIAVEGEFGGIAIVLTEETGVVRSLTIAVWSPVWVGTGHTTFR